MIEGLIYKISFNDDTCYVGSTTKTLNKRFSQHTQQLPSVNGFESYVKEKILTCDGFTKEILKKDVFFNKYDLLYWERILTDLTPNTINRRRCWITPEELKENKSKVDKRYREKHDEKLKAFKNKKVVCDLCGNEYSHSNKSRHLKSKLCLNNRNLN
jgi:hypothetical protein